MLHSLDTQIGKVRGGAKIEADDIWKALAPKQWPWGSGARAWDTKSKHRWPFLVPPSRSTRQIESPFIHPEERRTSSNTSYTTKIHLPRDTFADQMEYLSIHEPCEVQPRLPKETTLKELGLSWIWMTMACGTTKDHAVGHCNLPSSEEIRAPWSIKWGKKTSLTENKLTPLSSRGWVFNSFIFCEQYRAPLLTILSTWDPALPLFKNIS